MRSINSPTIADNGIVRPTLVEVDLDCLTQNYKRIKEKVTPATVMAILKANAYGHGLIDVAHHMVSLGVECLGVAVLEEGILLRENGIKLPILILGGIWGSQVPLFLEKDLALTASSIDKLHQIDQAAESMGLTAKVHLKIDTGMERLGVHHYSAESFLEEAIQAKHITIEGIFSHFANADAADLTSARLQLERYQEVLRFFESRSLPTPVRHMANSGAILQLPESYMDLVRPGILLYGVYPSFEVEKTVEVQPALSWKSRVVYFKVVKPGNPISYGWTWRSDHMIRVVTIPVGYGDGYFRSMTGNACVLLRENKYPVVGLICMDQVMVNIEWDSAYNGDEVILIGSDGVHTVTVEDLASWAGTIPYEVLTNINTRVPRIYHRSGQFI